MFDRTSSCSDSVEKNKPANSRLHRDFVSFLSNGCYSPAVGPTRRTPEVKTWKITILPGSSYPEELWLQLYVGQGVSGHEGLFLIPGVKIHTKHCAQAATCAQVFALIYILYAALYVHMWLDVTERRSRLFLYIYCRWQLVKKDFTHLCDTEFSPLVD